MIKRSIQQEDKTIISVNVPKAGASNFYKHD
jgi:hypothetical protein